MGFCTPLTLQTAMADVRVKQLEARLAELELENAILRNIIREMKIDRGETYQYTMDSLHQRRELALAENKRRYERQNGVVDIPEQTADVKELNGYDEID